MARISPPRTGRPVTLARNGMVATSHYLATEAGVATLSRGGSAVDAIIAANSVLCVAYPHMAGLGGDAFWLIWDNRERRLSALNGSGRSAEAATVDFYRDRGLNEIPSRGPLAANTVPGAVDAWAEAHQRHGRLEWGSLFERAVDHAEHGMPVSRSLARWLAKDRDILARHDLAARTFLKNGQPYKLGEVLVQPDLARSFREVATGGRDAFYKGRIAQQIVRYLQANGGLLGLEDFADHHSDWVEPIHTGYRGYEVYTFPPNTQGLALLLILNLLEGYDVEAMADGSADYVHHVVEATKLAFADRDRWVTDPDFLEVPMGALLSKEYAAQRRRQIDPNRALRFEDVAPGEPTRARTPAASAAGHGRAGDTVYLCAVDKDGNCASFIQSIYHDFGSAVIGGDTGIILQNRGSFFSLDPADPNRLEPHKRTFHTLMPSMMLRDGRPRLVFGTMGGEGQPQTQTAMVTRVVDFGYDVQQAIEAPRWLWGRAWGEPSRSLKMESRFPRETVEELRRRGHEVDVLDEWSDTMGHANQILIDPDSGVVRGASDPRGDGAAMGW